jgi:hypothetical protein
MFRMTGITTMVVGVGLMVAGICYHYVYFHGPLRPLESDNRAQLITASLSLVGGLLAMLGAILIHLKAAYDQVQPLESTKRVEHARRHLIGFAKLILFLSAMHLIIWLRIIFAVHPNEKIPMDYHLLLSYLLAGVGVFAGLLQLAKLLIWRAPIRLLIAAALLTPVPLVLLWASDWYVRHVQMVTYVFEGH